MPLLLAPKYVQISDWYIFMAQIDFKSLIDGNYKQLAKKDPIKVMSMSVSGLVSTPTYPFDNPDIGVLY